MGVLEGLRRRLGRVGRGVGYEKRGLEGKGLEGLLLYGRNIAGANIVFLESSMAAAQLKWARSNTRSSGTMSELLPVSSAWESVC